MDDWCESELALPKCLVKVYMDGSVILCKSNFEDLTTRLPLFKIKI